MQPHSAPTSSRNSASSVFMSCLNVSDMDNSHHRDLVILLISCTVVLRLWFCKTQCTVRYLGWLVVPLRLKVCSVNFLLAPILNLL